MKDLIERQDAIDAVHKEFDGCLVWDESGETTANAVEEILDGVPSAKPEWIPCSERLPEANGRYLVTRGLDVCGGAIWNRVYIINHSDLMGLKSERIWWCGNVGKSDFEHINDVIAWMPLPEAYREE